MGSLWYEVSQCVPAHLSVSPSRVYASGRVETTLPYHARFFYCAVSVAVGGFFALSLASSVSQSLKIPLLHVKKPRPFSLLLLMLSVSRVYWFHCSGSRVDAYIAIPG